MFISTDKKGTMPLVALPYPWNLQGQQIRMTRRDVNASLRLKSAPW